MEWSTKVPIYSEEPSLNEYDRVHLPGNVTLEFFRAKEMLHVSKLLRNRNSWALHFYSTSSTQYLKLN